MLELKQVTKAYDEKILDELSVTFPNIGLVIILGKSGCGKTTLLNLIGGLDENYHGKIIFDGCDIRMIKHYCQKHIGFVFQNFNLIKWLNCKENSHLPHFFTNIMYRRAIELYCKKLNIARLKYQNIRRISGGQKQRIALLRAVIKDVDILLCDEPTGALDNQNARYVFEFLKEEAKSRLVIVISHNEKLAQEYGDIIYTLSKGKLVGANENCNIEKFYTRLREKRKLGKLFNLVLYYFKANLIRNIKTCLGISLALIVLILTFAISDAFQRELKNQLDNIFPNQVISMFANTGNFPLKKLMNIKDPRRIDYIYSEVKDYEFLGLSLIPTYSLEKTIYINDMTKKIKPGQIDRGRMLKADNEIIISQTTANHLGSTDSSILNKNIYGFYEHQGVVKKISLKVVGISNNSSMLATMYLNEGANIRQICQLFDVPETKLDLTVAMMTLKHEVNSKQVIEELQKSYQNYSFKVAGEEYKAKVDEVFMIAKRILLLFSLLAVVGACFLIGEVMYLTVIEHVKDIGVFKCMGATNLQIMFMVFLESFILLNVAFVMAWIGCYQLVNLLNQLIIEGLQLNSYFIGVNYYLLGIIYFGALLLGIICAIFPAVYAAHLKPVVALRYH